jgi:hypothetical protein
VKNFASDKCFELADIHQTGIERAAGKKKKKKKKKGSLQCHHHIFNHTPSDLFPFGHIAHPGKDNVFSSSAHHETEAYSGKGESSLRSRTCTEWK